MTSTEPTARHLALHRGPHGPLLRRRPRWGRWGGPAPRSVAKGVTAKPGDGLRLVPALPGGKPPRSAPRERALRPPRYRAHWHRRPRPPPQLDRPPPASGLQLAPPLPHRLPVWPARQACRCLHRRPRCARQVAPTEGSPRLPHSQRQAISHHPAAHRRPVDASGSSLRPPSSGRGRQKRAPENPMAARVRTR